MTKLWQKAFTDRANHFNNPVAKKLCQIADHKKTNLVLSADVTSSDELLTLADKLGEHIAVLKTHIDIIRDFNVELIHELKKLSHKHHFLLFEDRKFADIGSTVIEQCRGGIYQISDWADIINAHIVSGPGIVSSLAKACESKDILLLLISELSARGTLASGEHHQKSLEFSKQDPHFCAGFIAQQRHLDDSQDRLYLSPGVHLDLSGDSLDQQYRTPQKAILEQGVDFIIVGRGIIKVNDPESVVLAYKRVAWGAIQKRI